MSILLFVFSFLFVENTVEVSDYLGDWNYEVTADVTYTGVMTLAKTDGEYSGHITSSEGYKIPFSDVVLDGNKLTFKMNVQGYPCNVSGSFEGDSFTGSVSVEGMEMPMKANRK